VQLSADYALPFRICFGESIAGLLVGFRPDPVCFFNRYCEGCSSHCDGVLTFHPPNSQSPDPSGGRVFSELQVA